MIYSGLLASPLGGGLHEFDGRELRWAEGSVRVDRVEPVGPTTFRVIGREMEVVLDAGTACERRRWIAAIRAYVFPLLPLTRPDTTTAVEISQLALTYVDSRRPDNPILEILAAVGSDISGLLVDELYCRLLLAASAAPRDAKNRAWELVAALAHRRPPSDVVLARLVRAAANAAATQADYTYDDHITKAHADAVKVQMDANIQAHAAVFSQLSQDPS